MFWNIQTKYKKAIYKDIDIKIIGRAINLISNNVEDIITMLRWLYNKNYLFDDKFVVSDIIIDKRRHEYKKGVDRIIGRIRNVNTKRIIAILNWFYLETASIIDYDYMLDVIKSKMYDEPLLVDFNQTEVTEWLQDHKAADEIV